MSEVRRVMPEEWVTLRSIRLTALRESPRSFLSTLEREAGMDEHEWRERARSIAWFLAWRDGRPVGIAGGSPGRPSGGSGGSSGEDRASAGREQRASAGGEERASADASGRAPGNERRVISMWVDPSARGTGIADALIGAVAGWARADGASILKLWVTDASPRARAFYRRAGFRPTGAEEKLSGDPDGMMREFILDLGS